MIWLLFLHHLSDAAFQPSWLIKNKHKHAFAVYEHAFIWAGTISFGLFCLGRFNTEKFIFLFAGHFLIDYLKYRYLTGYNWIYLDQLAYYLQILIVYL